MTISAQYARQNEALHENPAYGASGHLWLGHIAELADKSNSYTVLDYGCGKGTLGRYIPRLGLKYRGYDPAVHRFEADPDPAELVCCLDVLEHIEPDRLDATLGHIFSVTKKLAFFVVSTRPSSKTLDDGRNAHLIVEPYDPFWKTQLHMSGRWIGIQTRQFHDYFTFVGVRLDALKQSQIKAIRGT